jgi:hypothetical protein
MMDLTRLERALLGACLILLALVAYLLGYASLLPRPWSTGFMTGAIIGALQILWPSNFVRLEQGGFPHGVDQK